MKFHIYKDRAGEWRWRLRARNGRIVASSGEGFKRKASTLKSMSRFVDAISDGYYSFEETRDRGGKKK